MIDTVIRGGLLVDGVNLPWRADIAIEGGRIVAIDALEGVEAREVIDATERVVSPGFIDVHTHGDLLAVSDVDPGPLELAAIRQGVTTHIVGNCGFSVFGYEGASSEALQRHVGGLLGEDSQVWPTLREYSSDAVAKGLIMNTASLVGHGSLRACLIAESGVRTSNYGMALRQHIAEALAEGAVGFSAGLVYSPGVYAETQELVDACGALRGQGVPFVTHVRGETDHIEDSISEAIQIATRARVPLHVSHHKVAGPLNWGRSEQTLSMLQAATAEGLEVSLDVYPYTAASTSFHSLLPAWVQQHGFDALIQLLRQDSIRERLRSEIAQGGDQHWENLLGAAGWDGVRIARAPLGENWEGHSVAQVASRGRLDPLDAILDLQVESAQAITVVLDILSEDDMMRILSSPLSMVGSDGIPLPGKPHPRWAGSFARILGRYTRERGLLDLSTAVKKMSVMPATRFRLHGRGVLAVGAVADLVIFDPTTVEDTATFDAPLEEPRGVDLVMVNGAVTIRHGEFTGRRAGQFLKAGVGATPEQNV